MTISDPSLNGQAGLLNVVYNLEGGVSGSPFDNSINGNTPGEFIEYALVEIQANGSSAYTYESPELASSTGDVLVASPIPFVFGQALTLDLEVFAVVASPSVDGIEEVGASDFDQTLSLMGLMVADSNGNPVTGATFSAASGAQYSVNGVVPEPSMIRFSLLAFVILTLAKTVLSNQGKRRRAA